MESTKIQVESTDFLYQVISGVESTESTLSIWSPSGVQVDSTWNLTHNLAGLSAKENPGGVQVESTSPCGVHWIPPGIYGGV